MEAMLGDTGLRLGGQANVTIGNWGRNYDTAIGISNKGMAGTVTVAMSKGLFGGLSVEGAMLGVRPGVNDSFYKTVTTPHGIVDGSAELPSDKIELVSGVYEKLATLSSSSFGVKPTTGSPEREGEPEPAPATPTELMLAATATAVGSQSSEMTTSPVAPLITA
jgi:Las17-binding protein actin regulator